ncbi:M3 family metallopeptidase [Falsarthrobacter nasiphocae]|uniref:Peptidyl-dipeptidase Dcp n=1 Tax=Falsarthrobacter nasiphocae TaxID=189863 RepID=A0AAE4C649_9MICC|nr:M3 family metallopeptidase [Falsarthrobacter nasiphocae]MDR6892956.1 peptidyl-dipeptidase Dcp [Falsarthrobacter nasiphocae]
MKHHILNSSALPGGVPDYSELTPESLDELLAEATAHQRAAWAAIAENPESATFQNTIVPLEEAYAVAALAYAALGTFEGSCGTDEILDLSARWAPKLAEHSAAMAEDERLAARLSGLSTEGLSPEQAHLVSEWTKAFEAQGAFLAADVKEEVARIDAEIASLMSEHSTALLKGAEAAAFVTDREEDLAGLSEEAVARAAANAAEAGLPGHWRLTQDLFAAPSSLSSMTDRQARRTYYANSINRGRGPVRDTGSADTPENLTTAAKIAALRVKKAELFGFPRYADLSLRTSVAGDVNTALGMLERLIPAALASFERELDVMAEVSGMAREDIEASDVPYLQALVAKERYSVDEDALRPYFELDRVLNEGVFRAASGLYGISFRELTDVPTYRPDVRVWEVTDADGSRLGMFLGDFFARSTKQGGAWMHDLVPANGMTGARPVVMNTLNIQEPQPGEPALLSIDNVRTLFHEFGHALHSLLTDTGYVSNAGTNVPRDFVEYPSQVNEMWMFAPGVVEHYAVHHKTGEPLSAETIEAIRRSAVWGEGFSTSEYLGAALLDMAWHTRTSSDEPIETAEQALEFERSVLAKYGFEGLPVGPRYRTGTFKHIFGGGYAAGYYSYIFSEMMDAETVAWFEERGGLTRENGDAFRTALLSTGNRQDPAQSFRDLLGRDPEIAPLLTRRGLVVDDDR